MNIGHRFSKRNLTVVAILLVLAAVACNMPACQQETPTPPGPPTSTPLPAVSPEDLPDTNPRVVTQRPLKGEELPLDGAIDVYFNQAMDRASVQNALTLPEALQNSELTWVDDTQLRIKPPSGQLQRAERYRIVINEGAQAANGLGLEQAADINIQTVGFLEIGEVVPAPDAEAVEPSSVITVLFNRPVVPLALASDATADYPAPLTFEPALEGTGEWINTSIYQFTPDPALAGSTTYTVTVEAGLEDQTGGVLDETYTWSFSTLPPEVVSIAPTAEEPIPLDSTIEVEFNQPMSRQSVEANFSLQDAAGAFVGGAFDWAEDSRSFTFSPSSLLTYETTYTAAVAAGTVGAAGGASLGQDVQWTLRTVAAPRVVRTDPADGERGARVFGGIRFYFSAPMDRETLTADLLEVEPALPEQVTFFYSIYDNSWNINTELEPSTTYTVTLNPGAADPFGTTISQPYTFEFTTGPLDPLVQLNTQGQFGLYDASRTTQLFVLHRNISRINFQLARLSNADFARMTGPGSYEPLNNFSPSGNQLVRSWSIDTQGALNELTYARIPIVSDDGGSLSPGIYLLIADSPQIDGDTRHFMIVSNANLTFKSSFDEGFVWLTDFQSGQPIAGATVRFFDADYNEVGQSVTEADGVARDDLPLTESVYDLRYAVVAGDGLFALAMTDWSDGIDPWSFGSIPVQFNKEQFSLYMYTDRPIYRPGQQVHFKGVLRNKDDVDYTLPSASQITYRVLNDQGDVVQETTATLTRFGTFNGTFTLDDEAGLGFYNIVVRIGDRETSRGFQVADYRAPDFQVELAPEQEQVLVGSEITVNVDASFFFGGPVSNADVEWTVLSDRYVFDFTGSGRYSFYDDEQPNRQVQDFVPGFGEVIADGSGTTDASGAFAITLPADLTTTETSRRFTIEATVTDINEQSVSNRTEVIVHRSQYYVGVRPDVYVANQGEPFDASLILVDWNSEPVADREVSVELVEQRWNSVLEEDEFGRTQYTWNLEEIPTGEAVTVTTDDQGRASVSLTAANGGTFKVRASVVDPQGNTNRGSAFVWVSSPNFVPWRQTNDHRFDLVADKNTYQPGETAELLIASPFQGDDVRALITVERGGLISHEVITLPNNSYVYELPITAEHAPNIYVSVIIVKGVDDSNPTPDFKMGLTRLTVDPVQQEVTVTLTPDETTVEPRDTVTYTVETTDYQGNPVDAEVSLALVDLAVLQLVQPNSGPIIEHFYGNQGLSVRTAVPLIFLVDRLNQELFDEGKGGGGGAGEGFFEVRGDFRDTAYWEATVRTGENGSTTVEVTLPDNLTTWRMDARAVTQNTLVGQATVDIQSTKPLLIRPLTPRFFVAEDQAVLGAVVNNNSNRDVSAEVSLQAFGVTLEGDASQDIDIPAGGRAEVTWPVTVHADVDWVDLTFGVRGGGMQDASKPTLGDPDNERQLPVLHYAVPETVGTAGQLTGEGQRIEGVVLPPTYDVTQGNLQVTLNPSLAAATLDGLTYLEHFPYECTEQVVSKFLPNALTARTLREFEIEDADLQSELDQEIEVALQKLYSQQHVDGGWGWFVQTSSSPTVTSYVVQGLLAAHDAGYTIEQRVLDDALGYLEDQLQTLEALSAQHHLHTQAYILYILAEAGQPDESRTGQLFEIRQSMQHYAQALLAQTIWRINPDDSRLDTLQSDLNSAAIVSATGVHWEEEGSDRWNWNTDTRSTAIILDTYARIWPETDLAPNIVRWLMVARQGSHWETTQETAWAIIGLTNWMAATGELDADYNWSFEFNTTELASESADETNVTETHQISIPVRDMLADAVNTLAFERSAGPGRLYYTAHLTAYLPVQEVTPLSRGIIVSRRYLDADGNPVTSGQQGDTVTVELTIVAPNDLYYIVVEDPYPAGAEAINPELLTESVTASRPTLAPDDPLARGWGWWYFSNTDLRDEKAVLFADYLPRGTYQFTYDLRLGVPGSYQVIPSTAREFYFPEVYGRGSGSIFNITGD